MSRLLLVNASEPEETRVALVEEGRLEEFRRERAAGAPLVGSVYKGRVVNLEPAIGAAFVDIGVGRNGFLHVSDIPEAERRGSQRIEDHAPLDAEVLVQVTREAVGSKGPVLSADPSLPGRFLVLLPRSTARGVSRRIEDDAGREELRALSDELARRAKAGLIVRTAAAGATRRELARDLRDLRKLWTAIEARASALRAPAAVYSESDLLARALRDQLDRGVDEILVDTPEALARIRGMLAAERRRSPPAPVRLHEGPAPLFHAHGVEEQVDEAHARRVPLPGGGSLVIDRTEAMVAIDVNSGRGREEGLEETARKTNLEAAAEVARQIRLRDLGGVIAVDFIDMREAENVRAVERAFREALRRDRAPLTPGKLGPFAVFVLTRRRLGGEAANGERICPRCGGVGHVFSAEAVALRAFRELLAKAGGRGRSPIRALLAPEAAAHLRSSRAGAIRALSEERGREILVEADPSFPPDRWEVRTLR